MTNTFDFYSLKARGTRRQLRPIAQATGRQINTMRTGWRHYGRRSFPVYSSSISIGYIDVAGKSPEQIQAEGKAIIDRLGPAAAKVSIAYEYHARD